MIAVCGEALVDLLPTGTTTYEAKPGGSPANTAVALARLGIPVTLLARLSRDAFGRQLREHLSGNDVDLTHAVTAAEPSSLAIVSPDGSYRFVLDGAADWQWTDDELAPLPADVVAVHTGSLALATVPAIEWFLAGARATATICIDPNVRPSSVEAARASLPRWLQLADIVKASTEDIALLRPGANPLAIAHEWAEAGPALVVVTAGADGATALVAGETVHAPALPVDVADTVGAGDTFTAGLLAALHRTGHLGGRLDRLTADDVRPALDLAVRAAAVTCRRRGADPPRLDEL